MNERQHKQMFTGEQLIECTELCMAVGHVSIQGPSNSWHSLNAKNNVETY